MKTVFGVILFSVGLACSAIPLAEADSDPAQQEEIQALRREMQQLRADYETRIAELERRLDAAVQAPSRGDAVPGETAAPPPYPAEPESSYAASPLSSSASGGNDSAFNPAIGATFQGQAWTYGNNSDDYFVPGFPLGGEAGLSAKGLSLAETEISMSANVDDKFTARITVPIAVEDGNAEIELEEAWAETTALPAGFALRMGRFYADVGYLNSRHSHTWDFADQPLVYQAFLGNQYFDDGVQLRWLAPTDFYLELAGELFRGDSYPAGGAANSGLGTQTLTARTGGDVGFSNSWLFGLSWMDARADERSSGFEDDPLYFTGDTEMYIAEFVWKWAPYGNSRERNFKFQAEYMWRNEDGEYSLPWEVVEPWDQDSHGWYAQAVYQPFPQWRIGARYDRLSGGASDPAFVGTPLYSPGQDPSRYSLMVDWSNSEFSRLRFQYEHDQSGPEDDNLFALQYIFSIGAHGAHSF